MAKFYGPVGYLITEETRPGIWTERTVEHKYRGDLIRNTRKLQASDEFSDDITLTNEISIIADSFAYENFHLMKYVRYMGVNWKIISAEYKRPRIILTTGGIYNAPQPPTRIASDF